MSLGDDRSLSPIVAPDISSVLFGLRGSNADQIFRNVSWHISHDTGLSAKRVFDDINRIRKNKSLGIGNGVTVLDWKSTGIAHPYVLVAMLETPAAISSNSDQAEDILMVLLSPDSESMTHLRHLWQLTRMFHDHKILANLRSVNSEDGMLAVLSPENRKILAA